MKNKFINWIIIIASVFLLGGYLVWKEGMDTIKEIFMAFHYQWLVAGILSIMVYLVLDTVALFLIRKRYQEDCKFLATLRANLIGFMFGLLTPLQAGYLASEIALLSKDGMNAGDAATVLLAKTIYSMIAQVSIMVALVILQGREFLVYSALKLGVWAGIIIQILYLILLVFVAKAERVLTKLATWLITLLAKIKLVKKPDTLIQTASEEMHRLNVNMKNIKVSKSIIAACMGIMAVAVICQYQVTYFLYHGFGVETGFSYFQILAAQTFSTIIQLIMPIPGGLGAADSGYYYLMERVMGDAYINFSMILWRVLTLYLPIIIGLIALLGKKKPKIDDVSVPQ